MNRAGDQHALPDLAERRSRAWMRRLSALPAFGLILLVRIYQATLGPLLAGHCRFQPTCSVYAIEALRGHGALRGSWLAVKRLLRCHPLGGGGFDPVPPAENHDSARNVGDARDEEQ